MDIPDRRSPAAVAARGTSNQNPHGEQIGDVGMRVFRRRQRQSESGGAFRPISTNPFLLVLSGAVRRGRRS
jgi:hypothetical protein